MAGRLRCGRVNVWTGLETEEVFDLADETEELRRRLLVPNDSWW
jgi:hypothetical protein